jgi:hypothetical protein
MPQTRPAVISDRVSLSDKERREDRPFVAEDGAVDARLTAVVDEPAPYENSVCVSGSKGDDFARTDEQV